jgi:hypothetical protein
MRRSVIKDLHIIDQLLYAFVVPPADIDGGAEPR